METNSTNIICLIDVPTTSLSNSSAMVVEVSLGKTLNINNQLSPSSIEKLMNLLQEHNTTFAWEYKDMIGIDPTICKHHIYINDNAHPIRQPQHQMNPTLKDIVKIELQKLLDVDFIYPISDSQWVSPLVIVPKKGGKW
jgi:hypothetical protein